ncbi:unnamed protein product [Strongylus vulgaris]|uniref:Lipase n=1 Tax=Strongylus vulgaris TaxID=40348 RepID=A0A3P7IUW6_STRVU|nr:unnamed protein product [Strongylus vulgaris]
MQESNWDNPCFVKTKPEIIQYWGYPVEVHKVLTMDGYILTLHRIPYGRNCRQVTANRPVIFLQSGLLCSSAHWVLNLPHQSAGFVFADECFDVWLGNMRGNVYSKEHIRLNSLISDFWKFSWEEMARYDLPAMVDYVLDKTGANSLNYFATIGQGYNFYLAFKQNPVHVLFYIHYSMLFQIRKFFALAPAYRTFHVEGAMYHHFKQNYELTTLFYQLLGDTGIYFYDLTRPIAQAMCNNPVTNPMCEDFLAYVNGPKTDHFNSVSVFNFDELGIHDNKVKSRTAVYLSHGPAGTSTRNMRHYAQMLRTSRMASYDYGPEENLRHYGTVSLFTSTTPEYDISQVQANIYLFYADLDWVVPAQDVEQYLLPALPPSSLKLVR